MGKHSRKSIKGRNWKSSANAQSTPSRQQHRAVLRQLAFNGMSGVNILSDEHGFIPRKKRRDMARFLANQRWRMGHEQAKQ